MDEQRTIFGSPSIWNSISQSHENISSGVTSKPAIRGHVKTGHVKA
jgi:hypothetical protein